MAYQRVQKKPVAAPRGLLLAVFAASMLPTAIVALFKGRLLDVLQAGLVLALLASAALLTRRGIQQAREYSSSQLAISPRPYKFAGLVLAMLAAFLLAWSLSAFSFSVSLVFGLLAGAGYFLLYGLDPRGEKINQKVGGYSTHELLVIINEAEERLADIEQQRLKIGPGELSERLGRILLVAHDALETLEKNPRELRRARRFLNVYLDGAQRVTKGYAKMQAATGSEQLDEHFREVLVNIEEVFVAQREKLLANDLLDLDIQIEVLKKQLKEDELID